MTRTDIPPTGTSTRLCLQPKCDRALSNAAIAVTKSTTSDPPMPSDSEPGGTSPWPDEYPPARIDKARYSSSDKANRAHFGIERRSDGPDPTHTGSGPSKFKPANDTATG